MAKGLNLRAIFSADTSGIEKGSKRATQSIKTFDKEASGLLERFGDLIGVNTSKIGSMASAIEGFGTKTAAAAGLSAESIAKVSQSFKVLGGVIGGVAAVGIALWKSLSAEAEYYGTQLGGLGENAGLKAYMDTMRELRHEHRDGAGIQEFVNRMKRGWSSIANFFQGLFRSDVSLDEDKAKASQAATLAKIGTNIAVQELNVRKQVAEIDGQIAERRRQMNDDSLTYQQRQAAAASLADLVNRKAYLREDILQKQLANMKAQHDIVGDTLEDRQAEADLEIQILNVQKEREQEIKSIQKQQKSLRNETSAWLSSLDKMAMDEALEAIQVDIELNDQQLIDDIAALGPVIDAEIEALNAKLQPVELNVDPLPMVKTMDFLPIVEDAFKDTFKNIGTYIGEGLSGNEDAASNFSAAMLSTLGDMAIKVGELAISTGVALSAIQMSLNTMNPYLTIAAGAALVALGSAVKAGAANIAHGSSGYTSASVASSYGTSAVDNYTTRDISVNVTGTLVANGSQLVAVLNNENKRKNLTT